MPLNSQLEDRNEEASSREWEHKDLVFELRGPLYPNHVKLQTLKKQDLNRFQNNLYFRLLAENTLKSRPKLKHEVVSN